MQALPAWAPRCAQSRHARRPPVKLPSSRHWLLFRLRP